MSPPESRRSTPPGRPSGDLTREIRVAVVEEHEILRHGLVASLAEDQGVRVTSSERTDLGEDIDVAHLMVDAGLIVLVSFRAERAMARSLFECVSGENSRPRGALADPRLPR